MFDKCSQLLLGTFITITLIYGLSFKVILSSYTKENMLLQATLKNTESLLVKTAKSVNKEATKKMLQNVFHNFKKLPEKQQGEMIEVCLNKGTECLSSIENNKKFTKYLLGVR